MAEGNSIQARIRAVSQMTFTDEEGCPRQFTWRTIQTWYSRYKQHGVTVMQNKPRSDKGKVRKVPLEDVAEAAAAPAAPVMPTIMMAAKYVIPLLGVVLLFLFVIKPLMNAVTAPEPSLQQQITLPQTVAEIQKTIAIPEKSSHEQLVDWAKKNPKDATNLIKGWLEEK